MKYLLTALTGALAFASPSYANPTFILNDIGGVGAGTPARAAFVAAAGLWASAFSNTVTIRLDVGFQSIVGILGETGSNGSDVAYGTVRSALAARAGSAVDKSAVASLAPTLAFVSNIASNGTSGATTRVLENNQLNYDTQFLSVNTAEQKALGLATDNAASDGTIIFSSYYKWTFSDLGKIAAGTYDLVGIAAHEIGHALGFESGVDLGDEYAKYGASGLQNVGWGTPLDLFRYQNGQRDWTAAGTPCLSPDGGQSCGADFATGVNLGDHYQASHWKNGLHLGIMNPSASAGHALKISSNDLEAFDLIGWNLAQGGDTGNAVQWAATNTGPKPTYTLHAEAAHVPEPENLTLLAIVVAGLALGGRHRQG